MNRDKPKNSSYLEMTISSLHYAIQYSYEVN